MKTLIILMFVVFLVFCALNLPVGFAIGLGVTLPIILTGEFNLISVGNFIYSGIDSFPLLAVPFFILSGNLMTGGGISQGLVNLCKSFVGRIPGNLPVIAVIACTFFGAISGSAPATIAAIGGIMIPYMIEVGYPVPWVCALMATAGCIGSFIPPSIAMINYGITAGVSVSDMLLSGIGPGILTAIVFAVYAFWWSVKHRIPVNGDAFSIKNIIVALKQGIWPLLMPIIILGGIYGGFFTPTEAAAVSCGYALFVGLFITKKLRDKEKLKSIFWNSAILSGMIMLTMGVSAAFGKLLTIAQLPAALVSFVEANNITMIEFLICMLILFLFTGTFMNPLATVVIMTPMLLPIATALGVNPIHFGALMCVNTTFGMITPPLGSNLFFVCGMTGISFKEVLKSLGPFIIMAVGIIAVVTFIPAISLFPIK